MAYACLAEAALLAMEGRFECYTLGRDIDVDRVKEIYRLFRKHGFQIAGLRSGGKWLTEEDLAWKRALAAKLRADPELFARVQADAAAALAKRAAAPFSVLSPSEVAMFPIVEARWLAPEIKLFRIAAPRIAQKRQPGQFAIVRVHERGERIPLTLADSSPGEGTITLVVQGIGKTTRLLNRLEAGDALLDVVGPLGRPSEVERFGTVAVVGGGVGAAIAWPTAVAFHAAGNRVLTVLGARSRELVILEEELSRVSDLLVVATDDGSYGEQGLVTGPLARLLAAEKMERVLAIGPVPMMKAVALLTRPLGIKTIVSLNSIMVDGTGMCGGCRVLVGGESRFACVDGPEFDAHEVDFAVLQQRNAMYRSAEAAALRGFLDHPERDLALVERGQGGRGACQEERP